MKVVTAEFTNINSDQSKDQKQKFMCCFLGQTCLDKLKLSIQFVQHRVHKSTQPSPAQVSLFICFHQPALNSPMNIYMPELVQCLHNYFSDQFRDQAHTHFIGVPLPGARDVHGCFPANTTNQVRTKLLRLKLIWVSVSCIP